MVQNMKEEQPYSNREIQEFLATINETLHRIEAQTAKTNGRVSMLERWRTGIGMSIGIFIVIVMPLAVYAYNVSNENNRSTIENEILTSLQNQINVLQTNKVSK
jgi:hypothetical protein